MNRATIKKALGFTALAVPLVTLLFWGKISEAFGPMEQDESYCLICYRDRVEKWVCGSKTRNDITSNEYSDWVDSFASPDHEHVWAGCTTYHRARWFGPTSIGCGGVATIPRMFEQRDRLGESESQQLVLKYHSLIKQQSPQIDFDELARFVDVVVQDPDSLLAHEQDPE